MHMYLCFSGQRSYWHAYVCWSGHISVLNLYSEGLCVFLPEDEMGAASKEAAVRLSCAVNCVCVSLSLFVQLCACLCSLACADENRVTMLHLKGAVINEMYKRP